MAYADIGDVASGDIIAETWGDQVRANFQAGVPDIFTAKGDLAGGTGADAAARLAVGADDATLVADSGETTGMVWQIQPACRVYRNSDQGVDSAWESITFNQERFDTDSMHSVASNTSRITIPAGGAGLYLIGANIEFAEPGSGGVDVQIRILLGGSTVIAQSGKRRVTSGYGAYAIPISTLYNLSAGNYIEVQAWAEDALNVQYSGQYSPEFWAIWQRRA